MNSNNIFIHDPNEKSSIISQEVYDLAIIGAGPAGTTAAIYAARGDAKTIVLDKAPGTGALAITHKIANYPGQMDEVTGDTLITNMREHAKKFGASFVQTSVQGIMDGEEVKSVFTTDGILQAKAIFIAIGARGGRKNKINGEEEYVGRGVSYCATCDGSFYRGKKIAVIGDNEEAIEEAIVLQKFASEIVFFIPGKVISGKLSVDILSEYNHIKLVYSTKIKEIKGTDTVEIVVSEAGEEINVDGVFIFLAGNQPNTEFLKSVIEVTDDGYIKTNEFMETNVPGIFAGGDIRKPPIKQAVIAASDGAIAAMSCEKYLHKKKTVTPQYK